MTALASDAEGDFLTYLWRQTSGPDVLFEGFTSAELTIVTPQVTESQSISFTLFVSDGDKEVAVSTSLTLSDTAEVSEPQDSASGGSMPLSTLLLLAYLICMRRLPGCKEKQR